MCSSNTGKTITKGIIVREINLNKRNLKSVLLSLGVVDQEHDDDALIFSFVNHELFAVGICGLDDDKLSMMTVAKLGEVEKEDPIFDGVGFAVSRREVNSICRTDDALTLKVVKHRDSDTQEVNYLPFIQKNGLYNPIEVIENHPIPTWTSTIPRSFGNASGMVNVNFSGILTARLDEIADELHFDHPNYVETTYYSFVHQNSFGPALVSFGVEDAFAVVMPRSLSATDGFDKGIHLAAKISTRDMNKDAVKHNTFTGKVTVENKTNPDDFVWGF